MPVEVSSNEMILDTLMSHSNIKAAVIVDDRGYVVDQRGSALALKRIGEDDETVMTPKPDEDGPNENLYIVQAGDDFLAVIFDDRLNFEHLKKKVDDCLEEFGFRPDSS